MASVTPDGYLPSCQALSLASTYVYHWIVKGKVCHPSCQVLSLASTYVYHWIVKGKVCQPSCQVLSLATGDRSIPEQLD